MSILSSNNAGLQESIKQWWIGVREKNVTYTVDGSYINVVRNGSGYILVDGTWRSTSIKISDRDWDSRSPLLKNIFYAHMPWRGLTPINIDIMCNDSQAVVDLSNITTSIDSKTEMYLASKSRQKISIVCNCDDSIRISGLHSDNIDLEITDLKTPKYKNIQDIEGDINILLGSNSEWTEYINNIKINCLRINGLSKDKILKNWQEIILNKKKQKSGFVAQKDYIPILDNFLINNCIRRILIDSEMLSYPPHPGYDWYMTPNVTYAILPHKRYSYKLVYDCESKLM